ncbi:hypothetical protein [Candidatus Marithrix sp. Canyon 246]|uniref:hypothetical protein n=1 Tax=Candidatus Marithrix sp. Canyon 246 TaxID=1827136 RepID=UPI00084A2BB2|nr:hypothetical protein [Candidatus Marithrix sp. Canyon 246]
MKKNISELADMTGEINVDLRHVGMKADLILVVILNSETPQFFMLDHQGNFQNWNSVIPSHLVSFETDIRLKNRELVPIYNQKTLISGNFDVFFGYRLFIEDKVKIFGGGSIQIIVE